MLHSSEFLRHPLSSPYLRYDFLVVSSRKSPLDEHATVLTSSSIFRCTCGKRPNDISNSNSLLPSTSGLDLQLPSEPESVPSGDGLDMHSNALPSLINSTSQPRRQRFLAGLSQFMIVLGTPLPPTLTGVPNPAYDSHKSKWKILAISTRDTGIVRIAGQEVDLFKLFSLVFQAGGHEKVRKCIKLSKIWL